MKKLSILTILCLVATAIFADVSADLSVSTFFTAEQQTAVVNGDILPQMWVKYNAKNENSVEQLSIITRIIQYMKL